MAILPAALRSLRAHPLFSALVILLLALGIGANTAIFGVVHAVLIKPLPYPESGDLVFLRKPARGADSSPFSGDSMPDTELLAWTEAQPKSFRGLAGYRNTSVSYLRAGGAVRASAASVTGEFFPLLGVHAWRGRLFTSDDLKPGAAPVALLSYSAWQSHFGGEESALGQMVKLDEVAHTVIGVLPPAFEFVDAVQFWRPLALVPNTPGQLRIQMLRVIGRLLPGTKPTTAQAELAGISERYWQGLAAGFSAPAAASGNPAAPAAKPTPPPDATAPATPAPRTAARPSRPFADSQVQLVPLQEQLVKQARTTLWLLLCAVGAVLLIACANIANLQLARATGRRREFAVRAALGAGAARLATTLIVENLLLALAGGLLGVLLACAGTAALQGWLAGLLPRINPLAVDAPVLAFSLAMALLAGLGFGLAPAWQGSRVDLLETLKEGGHQASPAGHRWRQALVALEVALALVLAVNAGLLMKSLYQLYSTELGYRTADVLTANLSLPRRYTTPVQQRDFAERWLQALSALPGVKAAALTDSPPLSNTYTLVVSATPGAGRANPTITAQQPTMSVASASPDFFRATGIALKQGRFFAAQDSAEAPPVALVNEAFVREFYPQGLALGTPVSPPGRDQSKPAAIIGVVADIKPRGFDSTPQPLVYYPLAQRPTARPTAVLHFTGSAAALSRAIEQATHKVDADLALDQPATLEQQLTRQTAPRRVTLVLTGTLATTAVVLAALGLFSVMSYTVSQRTQEIGVRMALGADRTMILRWTLRQGALAIAIGLAVGLGLTLATSRLLKAYLIGITALDPVVLTAGLVLLAGVGLLACLLPALRATRVNPVDALRAE